MYILEATVTEERRRLMMEIIFHKCEFVGEMVTLQEAQRSLCLDSYDRIEQTLKECIAGEDAAREFIDPPGGDFNAQLPFWPDGNWLLAPNAFDLRKEARAYVETLLEMYQFCPSLRGCEEREA